MSCRQKTEIDEVCLINCDSIQHSSSLVPGAHRDFVKGACNTVNGEILIQKKISKVQIRTRCSHLFGANRTSLGVMRSSRRFRTVACKLHPLVRACTGSLT